jgi:SAM-dependent methyltransferase
MSDWQERITRETAPAIRGEHELRYRIVAPLIATSAVWADLGCGTGLAALAALGDSRPEHAVLVDVEQDVVAGAARELAVADTHELVGDLTDTDALARIGETLLGVEGERVVSCFEVVEHLSTFAPLLQWSGALAREGAATFVISVPNDAFWSLANPYHLTTWSEGAFEELRLLLPPQRTLFRQVALTGSALADWDGAREHHHVTVEAGGEGAVATHFIAAFGPRHREVTRSALATETDMLEQRRWERQRESNIAFAEELAREQREAIESQEQVIVQQRAELQANTAQFDEWRTYIHGLERELGKPLSGTPEAIQAETGKRPSRQESPTGPSEQESEE